MDHLNVDTLLTKIGRKSNLYNGVVNMPLFRASTYLFDNVKELQVSLDNQFDTLHYGRLSNPTTLALEEALSKLEGGYRTITGSSGLNVIVTVILSFITANSHILIPYNVYPGVRRFCSEVLDNFGISIEYYHPHNIHALIKSIRKNTSLIYIESPGTFDFRMIDLPLIVDSAKKFNIPVVVDNTWATPLFYKPLSYGADVSIHSATKYISGHSDVLIGAAICTKQVWDKVKQMAFLLGTCVSPDDSYATLKGLRTLSLRMNHHQSSAIQIANWLQNRNEVKKILFPALKSFPDHQLWKRDFLGASGRFAIKLIEISYMDMVSFIESLEHFKLGFSWGGFESIIMPFPILRVNSKLKYNFTIQISVGLENPIDLINDLEQAFSKINC